LLPTLRALLACRHVALLTAALASCRSATANIHAELADCLGVDLARRLQAVLALERDQRLVGLRTELAVDLDVKALAYQHLLHLADLFDAEVHGCAGARAHRSAVPVVEPRARCTDRNHRDDPVAVVDDHDVIAHHEIAVTAPFWMDADEHVGN